MKKLVLLIAAIAFMLPNPKPAKADPASLALGALIIGGAIAIHNDRRRYRRYYYRPYRYRGPRRRYYRRHYYRPYRYRPYRARRHRGYRNRRHYRRHYHRGHRHHRRRSENRPAYRPARAEVNPVRTYAPPPAPARPVEVRPNRVDTVPNPYAPKNR